VLRLTELATPAPGPGEILVDVALAAVNYYRRRDPAARRWTAPSRALSRSCRHSRRFGRIAAMGPDVAGLRVGQRVSVFPPLGGHASHVAVAAPLAVAAPGRGP